MTQTIESKGQRLVPTKQFFLDRFWVWIAGGLFWSAGALLLALFTPFWGSMQAIWQTPEAVAALQVEVTAMRSELNAATGDNRVIRQTPGLSYVTEPVHVGEGVIMNLVMERTTLGAKCIFVAGQSLFGEAGGVVTPGSEIRPSRQIGEETTRLRVKLVPPDTLRPGRIELYLALEYDCDGRRVFDRTDIVTYSLLPAPR
ncbi:hypothetical protein [Paracoccus laeviglucosivorans]|uniref:Uncharacterized protein n=1 Tax=Paracoccus laeviglucosivorans TaxID=1197861 RepID=A0A521CXF5_9RHOB|nr:hypothetical protein [Paracoccus laeviglucosivorans]SMO64127.1 hypothetical protein SAMN06265221_105255 [Paracoccus laeviglucosivorans]